MTSQGFNGLNPVIITSVSVSPFSFKTISYIGSNPSSKIDPLESGVYNLAFPPKVNVPILFKSNLYSDCK